VFLGGLLFFIFGVPGIFAAKSRDDTALLNATRVLAADLKEDMSLLRSEVARLKLDIERLTRENMELRRAQQFALKSQAERLATAATIADLNQSVSVLRNEFARADDIRKSEILVELSRQMETLASRTEEALNALADSVRAQPVAVREVKFSDEYPKEGVPYTVKSGDTLSKIAIRYESSIKDIQNANKIADPRDLRAGQTIFIPQGKK
jgi:LysM repeat protein